MAPHTITAPYRLNCSIFVKPESKSKSSIPCPNRTQILTPSSDQVKKPEIQIPWSGADTIITWATTTTTWLGKGSKKKEKKVENFPLGEGGPENFKNFSHFFLFIFKHGLNHPEMKRNFFSKVGTPPYPFPPPVGNFPTCF